jgi:hypothetical protein
VVVRSGWGGTLIDLRSGERTQMHGEEELWYDPQRGIRDVSLFGGVVQFVRVYPPGRVSFLDRTLAGLATGYRQALRDGSARVLGPDELDGEPVYWIRVDTQMLPDAADGKLHAWAHDVAVSQRTFEPVATRETRDGEPGPDGNSTIVSVETLPAGDGDFSAAGDAEPQRIRSPRSDPLTAAAANDVLGGRLLWTGESVAGLELARIWSRAPQAYDEQTKTWRKLPAEVSLFYGHLDPGTWYPGVAPAGVVPTPFVQVSETLGLHPGFQRGVSSYSPPEGTILVFGGDIGVMQRGGVHLALEASSEDVLLAAARALEPAPG